ncbi:O-methyltransferase [Streptomyces sp. NPDC048639]|uniref:O-methyltransferase n=1 Tax=Streptomyces sp. NPDC048639 TaxID=3365581 RepID=UPI00371A3300
MATTNSPALRRALHTRESVMTTVANRFRPVAVAALAAIRRPITVDDPFAAVRAATRSHRRAHRCGAYAYGEGTLPATAAAAVGARRIVEVGTALGYTAIAMAHATPDTHVQTIEMDQEHVRLAEEQIAAHHLADRITVLHDTAENALRTLDDGDYDLAFFDGFTPTLNVVTELHRLLRTGGSLIAGNLILGPDRDVTDFLSDTALWRTHSFGETAWSVKLSGR